MVAWLRNFYPLENNSYALGTRIKTRAALFATALWISFALICLHISKSICS
jgi:hypothetical protein